MIIWIFYFIYMKLRMETRLHEITRRAEGTGFLLTVTTTTKQILMCYIQCLVWCPALWGLLWIIFLLIIFSLSFIISSTSSALNWAPTPFLRFTCYIKEMAVTFRMLYNGGGFFDMVRKHFLGSNIFLYILRVFFAWEEINKLQEFWNRYKSENYIVTEIIRLFHHL